MYLEFDSPYIAFLYANRSIICHAFAQLFIVILLVKNHRLKKRVTYIEDYLSCKENRESDYESKNNDENK